MTKPDSEKLDVPLRINIHPTTKEIIFESAEELGISNSLLVRKLLEYYSTLPKKERLKVLFES